MPLLGKKRSKVHAAEDEPDDETELPTTPRRETHTAERLQIESPGLVPEPEPNSVLRASPHPRTPRSSASDTRPLTPSSTTSSLWQVYVEDDAATQIQKLARGVIVRQDMSDAEADLAIEIEDEEREAAQLALEAEREAKQLALAQEEEAEWLAQEELRWVQLRAQFKQGTHARAEDGSIGIVTADVESIVGQRVSRHVDLCLTNGSVRAGVMLDKLTALTSAEIKALDDEESRLDTDFIAQEHRNNRTIEAWVGLTRRSATHIVQSYARGWIARRLLQKQTQAVVVIQSVTRGILCRLRLAEEVTREARREPAAVAIQAALRGHQVRTRLRTRQACVTSIQAAWRGYRCRAELRTARLQDLTRQLLCVMANAKAHAALRRWCDWVTETRRLREIGTLAVRRLLQRKVYQVFTIWCEITIDTQEEKLAAAIRLQAGARGWRCRRTLAQYRAGIVLLQAAVRGAAARAQVALLHQAASRIQALVRGWSTRRRVAATYEGATVIQRIWRGFCCRNELMMKHSAATAIQAVVRGVQVRVRYNTTLAATQAIQRIWRGHSCRRLLAALHSSAVVLQSASRCWLARLDYTTALERMRQEQLRAAEERKMQIVREACARTVQGRMRDWIYRRRTNRAAAFIQKIWRGRQCRLRFLEQWRRHKSAVLIQKMWRGTLRRRIFTLLRAAAITIQSRWRTYVQVRWYRQTKVAIKLQCHWRGRGARKFHRSLLTIKRVENRGDDAFQRRWFEEAVLEYSDADKLCQGEVPRLKCKRAAAFTALGMYKEAVEDCDRVLRVQPSYAAAYRRKATALYAMGQFLEARQSYLACLEITPDDAEAARLLARLTTVLELRKRAQGDSSSQVPRSQLLIQRAQVLSNSIERAWNRPVPRPKPVPRELERMRRAASYHQKLADRGQSVYELQVQVDAAGNYKTVQRPKSRPSNGDRLTDSLEQTASKVQVAQTEVLHLPPIDAHVA